MFRLKHVSMEISGGLLLPEGLWKGKNDIPKRLWNKKNTRLWSMSLAAVHSLALLHIESGDIQIS